jgi:hypothetical protein
MLANMLSTIAWNWSRMREGRLDPKVEGAPTTLCWRR